MSTIKDKLLEPYFIECEEFSYTVKMDTGKFSTDKKSGETKPIYELKGYYSNKLGAVKKIVQLKMNSSEEVRTINQYFTEQNQLIRDLIKELGESDGK
jgi:hypothetical protein